MDDKLSPLKPAREDYLDYAKGIGMFLVIWAHVITWQKGNLMIKQIIYQFHMPLFFLVSGFVLSLKKKNDMIRLKDSLIKECKKLVSIYVVWSILYIILEVAKAYLKGKAVKNLAIQKVMAFLTLRGIAPIWFLSALVLCKIFYILFMHFVNKKRSETITIVCILALAVCSVVAWKVFPMIDISRVRYEYPAITIARFWPTIFFFMMGYEIGLHREILKKYAGLIMPISGVLFFGLWYVTRNPINLHLFVVGKMIPFLITGVVGSMFVITLCMLLPSGLFLRKIGSASLDIMLVHYPPIPVYAVLLRVMVKVDCVMTPIVVALILMILSYILHLYLLNPLRNLWKKLLGKTLHK